MSQTLTVHAEKSVNQFCGELAKAYEVEQPALAKMFSVVGPMETTLRKAILASVEFLGLITCQRIKKFTRPRFSNSPDMIDHFLPGHTDAIIGNRESARLFVIRNSNLEIRIRFVECCIRQSFKSKFIGSIGGIRNQFPQEYFLITV